MTQLRTPLKHALRKTTTEASVARMWARIEARERTRTGPAAPRSPASAIPRVWALAAASVLILGLLFAGARAAHRGEEVAVARVPSAPLARADGAAFVGLHAGAEPAAVTLSDGSTIRLSPGATVETRANEERAIALEQPRGRVHYDVTPGGPRRWTIACGARGGAATVEVVGTSFEIDADDAHVRVDVSRGVVIVRGEGVPAGQQRLVAGGSIDVVAHVRNVRDLRDSDEAPAVAGAAPTPTPTASTRVTAVGDRSLATTWKPLVAKGEHAAAYAELGANGVARATKAAATVDDLLALADIARLSGHASEAVPPLERILTVHAGDARASLAALTLGRIELTSLSNPHGAIGPLRAALALGIPRDLEGDTHALLIEAFGRDGDAEGARAAFDVYVARHPTHPKRASVMRWLAGQ